MRVLDLGGLPSMYASKLLADFGASVTLLEGPNGDAKPSTCHPTPVEKQARSAVSSFTHSTPTSAVPSRTLQPTRDATSSVALPVTQMFSWKRTRPATWTRSALISRACAQRIPA